MKITYQNESKERLDKFLVLEMPDLSRSKIQKIIQDELVTINGKVVTSHFKLKTGDEIEIINKPKAIPVKHELVINISFDIKIIDETDDYIIINKPTGLIVHPAESVKEPTLTDWLIDKYPDIKKVGEDKLRPGIVHRLDKEVSGLMIAAKTQKMFKHLKKQFQDHQITKKYLGLVQGVIEADEGVIDFPLKRSKLTGKIVAKPKGDEGKESITEYTVLKRYVNYTYLNINLKTGRSHQIRAHLQAIDHPLVGDKLYKNKKIKDKIKLDRIFLHSHILKFTNLENELQEYQNDLPQDLKQILNEIT